MEFRWISDGIQMEFRWSSYGIQMDFIWDAYGIKMEFKHTCIMYCRMEFKIKAMFMHTAEHSDSFLKACGR